MNPPTGEVRPEHESQQRFHKELTDPSSQIEARSGLGRPIGSGVLTPQVQAIIVAGIADGWWDYVAAEAASIGPRTFYEWMARGEGKHPTRPPTPELEEFARQVRQARAIARGRAESRVYHSDPKFWLRHAARSRPGREGWTEPQPSQLEVVGDTPDSVPIPERSNDGPSSVRHKEEPA